MTEKELSHLTKLIKEVSLSPDADEKIALILKMASESITEDKIKGLVDKDDKRKVKSGILKFSKKEMDKMPTSLKNLFAHNDIIVRYRYYKGLFQARYRKNGMNIEVASTDFNTMKRKFIAKLCERQGDTVQPKQTKSTVTFADCAQAWLKLKERTTKPSTYKEYLRSYNVNLQPVFGDYRLCEITRGMVQDYLFSFVDKGNHRTAEKLKLQLKCIFDLAAEDYKIPSPMNKIVLPYRQTKKGRAFTYAEERKLVDFCTQKQDNAASSALLVLLYFGLRQSELASIRVVDGKYLECETSKERLGRNVVVRRIPLTPVFRRVEKYVDFAKAKATNPRTIATTLKRLFPEHHPHELRYTYITRVKEAGVNQELVMLWDGHSFDKDVKTSAVDRGYTTYSEEYILSEANKVDYKF